MELELLRAIQSFTPDWLDTAAQAVTMLGESFLLLVPVCVVYWTVSKEHGEAMALSIMASLFFNNALKAIFMRPRPIGADGIRSLRIETATGSSFPSGHTQNTAAVYTALACAFRKRWLAVVAAAVISLVGLSRLYLGVHWPSDILAGAALGAGISFALSRLSYYNIYDKHVAFAFIALAALAAALICGQADMVKSAGLACGAAVAVRAEHRFVGFTTDKPRARLAARFFIGIAVVAAVYLLPKLFLPETVVFAFIRYFAVALAAMLGCPWIFVKLRL